MGQRPRPDPRRDRGDPPGDGRDRRGDRLQGRRQVTGEGIARRKKDAAISKVTGAMPETDGVSRGAKKTVGVAKENPLGLAVGGIAVGFLVGLLLPATRGRTSGSVKSATRFARASRTPDRKPWNGASTSRRKPPTQPQQQRGTAAANRPRTWPRHSRRRPRRSPPRQPAAPRPRARRPGRRAGPLCAAPRKLTRKAGCLRSRRTCVSQQVDEGEHAGRRRDRRSRFPGWIEVQGRSSDPAAGGPRGPRS